MSITFKWVVNKVQVVEDNLIVAVELTVVGTNETSSASASYSRNLVRSDTFIPYEQLTEQQVIDWCFKPETITFNNPINNTTFTRTRFIKNEGENEITNQLLHQPAKKVAEPALPWV
jgi:hypothetical protein